MARSKKKQAQNENLVQHEDLAAALEKHRQQKQNHRQELVEAIQASLKGTTVTGNPKEELAEESVENNCHFCGRKDDIIVLAGKCNKEKICGSCIYAAMEFHRSTLGKDYVDDNSRVHASLR